jgi:hypothetical protein
LIVSNRGGDALQRVQQVTGIDAKSRRPLRISEFDPFCEKSLAAPHKYYSEERKSSIVGSINCEEESWTRRLTVSY